MPSNVPDTLNGWEEEFVVPSQFSERTMASISNGNITSSARNEIIQMTVAKMLSYCKYPTAIQYKTVARNIVATLLKGKGDKIGSGHVSFVCIKCHGYYFYLITTGILDKATAEPVSEHPS